MQPFTPYNSGARHQHAATRAGRGSFLSSVWRYRALLGGVAAIVLAMTGEWLMRHQEGVPAPNAALGERLVQVAVVLVGVVAWVRDGSLRRRSPSKLEEGNTLAPLAPLPVRRAGAANGTPVEVDLATSRPVSASGAGLFTISRSIANKYRQGRAWLGWRGTLVGLAITGGLGVWLGLLLREDFAHPSAPYVWVAMLAALAITFVGVRPWPRGASLLPNDPAEPAREPLVSRTEWLVLGLIMVAAIALRFWDLGNIPAGPYIDEADRAIDARHLNNGEPVNQTPFVFFGTGWWGVPSFYFWLVAQSMKLFGDDLFGARVMHALAGVLAVWFTYRLVRAIWSPRAGLLAGALMAASDFAIQFSRTAGESTITLTTWLICFYYLYKGLKTRRPLDFVWCGLAAGLTLYGYVSSKLLPVFMVLIALYILVRWGVTGAKRYLPGLVLLALAAGLTYAPNGLYILTQNPEAFTARSNGVAIWAPQNQAAMAATYSTSNWGLIVAGQLGLTYNAFDVGREHGPFYPTNQPILPVPWAALWILGTAYMVWRIGDARYGILAAWLLSGLAGAALTNETPSLQRVAGMVPLLAILPAIFLDRVASSLAPFVSRVRSLSLRVPRRTLVVRAVTNISLAALVLLLASQTLGFYFGPYTAQANWREFALAGQYASGLNPAIDMVSYSGLPVWNGDPSPTIFLANRVPLREFGNGSETLPVTNNDGKNLHFIFSPPNDPIGSLLQAYYPDGDKKVLTKLDGTPLMTIFTLTGKQLNAQRFVTARYSSAQSPAIERQEAKLGTQGTDDTESAIPPGLTYPVDAEWAGGMVAPVYGTYSFTLDAPGGASLEIDGRRVLTATAGTASLETPLILARGVHSVKLSGKMQDPQAPIDLRWGAFGAGRYTPIPREFLWGGPLGTLRGESYMYALDPNWFLAEKPEFAGILPLIERRDGFLQWQSINTTLNGSTTVVGIWRGKVIAPVAGDYLFDASTKDTGITSIWVDGKFGGAAGIGPVPTLPAKFQLTAGEHQLEVRLGAKQDNASLELYWQPPNGERRLITPKDLAPAEGGVWLPTELPGAVPSPDLALIGAVSRTKVQVARTIQLSAGLREPRGVGVLPGGGFVVGDTGNRKLVFYDQAGKQYASWGGGEGTPDSFNQVSDVAVDAEGTVAALDAENGDIRLFSSEGKLLSHLPASKLQISHSSGLAWGPGGKIYVADTAGSRIVKFDREGTTEAVYHEGRGAVAPVEQPVDVAVTAEGIVFAVDLRGRLVRLNSNGVADKEWKIGVGIQRGGSHIAVWGTRIALTNPDTNSLVLIDPVGGLVHQVENQGQAPLELAMPVGVASGPADKLTVLNTSTGILVVLETVP